MPATQIYRRTSVFDLAADPSALVAGRPAAQRLPFLPASAVEVPALDFGDRDLTRGAIELVHKFHDPQPSRLTRAQPTPAFLLRDVTVHGKYGVITWNDRVLNETLYHFPMHDIAGAAWEGTSGLRLPLLPLSSSLASAYHLLACNLGNYYHWMIDLIARYRPAMRESLRGTQGFDALPLLMPELDAIWKWETITLAMDKSEPHMLLSAQDRLFVKQLLYVPDLSGFGFNPHAALLETFDRIRDNALGRLGGLGGLGGPSGTGGTSLPTPGRRLYICRLDSRSRMLINEAQVIERARQAGFSPIVLSKLSVRDQVRLFSEASHILAPHGAGLTNIVFCQPGAVLCELHMDSYVHWGFRVLAATRGVRYGCLIGETVGERQPWVHSNAWRMDLAALDAMLEAL
jgi:hypothetical protein